MPLSNDIRLYDDIRPYLDRALESEKGLRIRTPSKGLAISMRQRLQKLRQLEKLLSVEIYQEGDPRRSVTPWDNISMNVSGTSDAGILELVPRAPVTVEDIE